MGAGSGPHVQPEWGFLANPWFSRLRMNFAESHGFAGNLESQPQTIVTLDAKISAAQLPPPPFRGVVKGAPRPPQLATCHSVSSRGWSAFVDVFYLLLCCLLLLVLVMLCTPHCHQHQSLPLFNFSCSWATYGRLHLPNVGLQA